MPVAAPDLTIKQHDLYPPLVATLNDTVANIPIDLTTATAVVVILKGTSGAAKVGVCTVTDAVNGQVTYNWVSGDTDVADTYNVEWQITWPGALPQTVPNGSFKTLLITPDLGP